MSKSESCLFNNYFSHIYVEEAAYAYPLTKKILNMLKQSMVINIRHYKDVFCKRNQNIAMQKNCKSLILAVQTGKHYYKGSNMCDSFGNENFYYTSQILNCIYNCDYCYLQGLYPSANLVVFVNIDDTFREIDGLASHENAYFCISYDCDLLSMEGITGFVEEWLKFAYGRHRLKIEIRTKSAAFDKIKDLPIGNNIIFAWSLSPQEIIRQFEKGTPSLQSRLINIKEAISRGLQVRLCFDPLLYVSDFEEIYHGFIGYVFKELEGFKPCDISLGVFRVPEKFLNKMEAINKGSKLYAYTYTPQRENYMKAFVSDRIKNFIKDENKIFIGGNHEDN